MIGLDVTKARCGLRVEHRGDDRGLHSESSVRAMMDEGRRLNDAMGSVNYCLNYGLAR